MTGCSSLSIRKTKWIPALWLILAIQLHCGSETELKNGGAPFPDVEYANPEILLSTDELALHLDDPDLALVDARPPDAYRSAHIPGAINLQWTHFTYLGSSGSKFWQLLPVWLVRLRLGLQGISRSDTLVIYNDQQTGWGEDGRFFWMFAYVGHERVRILNGGWSRWAAEGRATQGGSESRGVGLYEVDLQPDLIAEKERVLAAIDDPQVLIVDTRTREEYDGAVLYGEARGGHIPGAEHFHWKTAIGPDLRLRSAGELTAMLDALGVTREREVVVYCTGGVRSGHLFFVLKLLGFQHVRNYDGSFWEWAADSELPVE